MSLFDFLKPAAGRAQAALFGEDTIAPGRTVEPIGERDPTLTVAPQMEHHQGLLGQAGDYLKGAIKDPNTWMAVASAMRSAGGNENAFQDLSAIQERSRAAEKAAVAKADRARKNAAFKSAYQGGKFNPQAYIDGLGDADIDAAAEAADYQKAFGPKTGVDGGFAYSIGPDGNVEWGEQRPISHDEQNDQARAAYLEQVARERLTNEDERIALARQREGRVARGGGAGGKPQTFNVGVPDLEAEMRRRGLIP